MNNQINIEQEEGSVELRETIMWYLSFLGRLPLIIFGGTPKIEGRGPGFYQIRGQKPPTLKGGGWKLDEENPKIEEGISPNYTIEG